MSGDFKSLRLFKLKSFANSPLKYETQVTGSLQSNTEKNGGERALDSVFGPRVNLFDT